MLKMKKNILLLHVLNLLLATAIIKGDDFITITNPANSASVSGSPLVINGTSSQANYSVRIFINTTEIPYATTDSNGDWTISSEGIADGDYTVTAYLVNANYGTLATAQNSFSVTNPDSISITIPESEATLFFDPVTIAGISSLPSTTVRLSLDGNIITTTTTDANGDWQTSYVITTNGVHTLLAELMVSGSPVASSSIDILANIPFVFPTGTSQLRLIDGNIPTSGSGSGQGYTYSVSGSTITINFTPAFAVIPSVTATGLRASGSSTVTLSSVSTTAASVIFSTGTQKVHFSASALQ